MKIGICGQIEEVGFWPAEEIEAVFKRVNNAMGKQNEVEEMRLFVRAMNYFYEQASISAGELDEAEMVEVCRLAKKGLHMELDITEPEDKTA